MNLTPTHGSRPKWHVLAILTAMLVIACGLAYLSTQGFGETFLWLPWFGLYFAPTAVACLRRRTNVLAVFLLNALLGWTVIGLLLSMKMACVKAPALSVSSALPDQRSGMVGTLVFGYVLMFAAFFDIHVNHWIPIPFVGSDSEYRAVLVVLTVLYPIYFLPSVITCCFRRTSTTEIYLLNLLTGWTGGGWLLALLWACLAKESAD